MPTPREEYPELVAELIREHGDDPQYYVTYEEWYFGNEPGDPPSFFKVEVFHADEVRAAMWGTECALMIPGTTEEFLADWPLEKDLHAND